MLNKIVLFCLLPLCVQGSLYHNPKHIFSKSIPIQEIQDLILAYIDDFQFSPVASLSHESIEKIIWINNGRNFLTIGKNKDVLAWDAVAFTLLYPIITSAGLRAITHSAKHNQVVLLSKDFGKDTCFIEICSGVAPEVLEEIPITSKQARDLQFAPDGRFLAVLSSDKIQLLDPVAHTIMHMLPKQAIVAIVIAPNSKYIALITRRDGVKIWDILNNKIKNMKHQSSDSTLSGIAYAPNSKQIAAIGTDSCIVWDTQTGKKLFANQNNQWRNSHISYLPHGNSLAIGSNNQLTNCAKIDIIDVRTFALLQTLKRDGQQITCFSFSPNKKFLLAVCSSGNLLTWVNQIGDFVHKSAEETRLEKESKTESGCVIC